MNHRSRIVSEMQRVLTYSLCLPRDYWRCLQVLGAGETHLLRCGSHLSSCLVKNDHSTMVVSGLPAIIMELCLRGWDRPGLGGVGRMPLKGRPPPSFLLWESPSLQKRGSHPPADGDPQGPRHHAPDGDRSRGPEHEHRWRSKML